MQLNIPYMSVLDLILEKHAKHFIKKKLANNVKFNTQTLLRISKIFVHTFRYTFPEPRRHYDKKKKQALKIVN